MNAQNKQNRQQTSAQKRVATLLAKDPNYFKVNGAKGGKALTTKPKGMAWLKQHDPDRLKVIVRMGGKASKRPKELI